MKKKIIKVTSFILAVAIFFTSVYFVYDFKDADSVFKMKMFYKQKENTVDVLVLGSSHAYQGINTSVLWKEYGYPAYNLGGAAQPIWNTYYYLEEALKTQSPKVIILDAFCIHHTKDYSETSFGIKNTYGLKWSKTKVDAIRASFSPEDYGYQFFIPILQYHSRYRDLSEKDFYPYLDNENVYKNHKGFYCYFYTTPVEENEGLKNVAYEDKMTEKVETYFRKIIETALKNNIKVIGAAIPFANAEIYHQAFFNTAKKVFEEYGLPFYNFLTEYDDELNLDYDTDFSDSEHLNHLGNTKLTRFIGDLLKDEYNLPDRRGDAKYSSWDEDSDVYYKQLEDHDVADSEDVFDFMSNLSRDRYKTVVVENINKDDELSENAEYYVNTIYDYLDFHEDERGKGGMWVYEGGNRVYYSDCFGDNFQKMVNLAGRDSCLVKKTEKGTCVFYDKKNKTTVASGITILVYDTFTKSLVDSVNFDYMSLSLSRPE